VSPISCTGHCPAALLPFFYTLVPSAPRCVGLADLSVMPPEESERTVAPIPLPGSAVFVTVAVHQAILMLLRGVHLALHMDEPTWLTVVERCLAPWPEFFMAC